MAEKRTADGIIDKEDPQDMTVNVTLRYLSKEQVNIKKEITLENSCTAGELSARIMGLILLTYRFFFFLTSILGIYFNIC